MLVRVMDGTLRPKDKILLMAAGATYNCEQVGVFTPKSVARDELAAGDVGFIIAGIKEIDAAQGRATRSRSPRGPAAAPLPGLQGGQAAGVRRASIRSRPTSTRRCATRSTSSS